MPSCAIGGTIYLTVNGQQISPRGAFDIQPLNFERDAESNQDGTMYVTEKSVPATATGSISYTSGLDLQALYSLCGVTCTIALVNGDTFVFSSASVVGTPKLNTEKGEISDFKIASASARKVNGS
jgi:hypothetical protein